MKFHLVDKIVRIEPGKRIVAVKNLSLAEEYLADHFPAFPVLPGVLMLEALVQAAAWLVRLQQDWSRSLIVLAAARNVRYGHFVAPGDALRIEADLVSLEDDLAKVKAAGYVGNGQRAVEGRLELRCARVAQVCAAAAGADEKILASLRKEFTLLGGPEAIVAAEGAGAG